MSNRKISVTVDVKTPDIEGRPVQIDNGKKMVSVAGIHWETQTVRDTTTKALG